MDINWAAEAFDTAFNMLGKYGKWLNVKGKRSCFILWIICCVYWFFIDLKRNLISQAIFTIFSIGFHGYGFYNWKVKKFGENND